ncbi:MAG: cytochrome c [Gammaproteobacteria bacterium]
MRIFTSIITLLLAFTAMPVLAEGDASEGRKLAETCLGCHAGKVTNASPMYHVPKLGGQHPDYIIAALKAYKAGQRWHPTMQANAADLSEADMANIASYISSIQ